MTTSRTRRLAVLASGRGSNFRALAEAGRAGALGGDVVVLLTDRPGAGAIEIARALGIPVEVADPGPRAAHLTEDASDAWVATLRAHAVDTVLLAGFMRIVPASFLAAFPERVLNIHPSLLPAFPGRDAIARAFEHGARVTGVTVHLVTRGVDEGPILLQEAVPVGEDDTLESLAARIHAVEHRLYPRAVHLFLTRPHHVEGRRVVWGAGATA